MPSRDHHDRRYQSTPFSGSRFAIVACLVFFAAATGARADGELENIRRRVRKDSPDTRRSSDAPFHCDECGHAPCCCDGDHETFLSIIFGEFVGRAIFYTVASPGWMPHEMLGDDFANTTEFLEYPYADDQPGALAINKFPDIDSSPWVGQFTAEAGSDFDNLDRIGGRLQFDTASRFGIDAEFDKFDESLHGGGSDSLWIGDLNLVYRFAVE